MKKSLLAISALASIGIVFALGISLFSGYPLDFESYSSDSEFDNDTFFTQTVAGASFSPNGTINWVEGCGVLGSNCVQLNATPSNSGPRLQRLESDVTLEAGKTYFFSYRGKGEATTRNILQKGVNKGIARVQKSIMNDTSFHTILSTFVPLQNTTGPTWNVDVLKGVLSIDSVCFGEIQNLTNGSVIYNENFENIPNDPIFDADPSFIQSTVGEPVLNPFAGQIDLVIDGSKAVLMATNEDYANRLDILKNVSVTKAHYYQFTFSVKGDAKVRAEVREDADKAFGATVFKGTDLNPTAYQTVTVGYVPVADGNIDLRLQGSEGVLFFDNLVVTDYGDIEFGGGGLGGSGCDTDIT